MAIMSKEITLTEYNKKIEELKEKRCQLWSQIHEIDAQIDSLEIRNIDFVGKYIYVPVYGNMFVLDEYPDKDSDSINFRGITFKHSEGSLYLNDTYLLIDGYDSWCIPVATWNMHFEKGDIRILNNKEFIKDFLEVTNKFTEHAKDLFLKKIEEYSKND